MASESIDSEPIRARGIIVNYPVLCQSTPLNAIPKLEHLKARRELNRQEKDLMIEWEKNNGKAARQRSVRQETTMFKALPSSSRIFEHLKNGTIAHFNGFLP